MNGGHGLQPGTLELADGGGRTHVVARQWDGEQGRFRVRHVRPQAVFASTAAERGRPRMMKARTSTSVIAMNMVPTSRLLELPCLPGWLIMPDSDCCGGKIDRLISFFGI